MQPGVRIVEVEPADEVALRAFWETEQEAARHDRPHAVLRTWEALRSTVQVPNPYRVRRLLAAVDDRGSTVGVADLGMWLQDNLHLAELEVNVLPARRRGGIGRALHDAADALRRAEGRTTVIGEACEPTRGAGSAGVAFAEALGFASAHVEDHLLLPLPSDTERPAGARPGVASYELLTWTDRCPDPLVEGFCVLLSQMVADVPTGDLDLEAVVWDEQRLRTSEQRLARGYTSVIAVARRDDGVLGGYSQLLLPRGERYGLQDDTLVMPEHRGRRLGAALKTATLEVVRREHPERECLHTWTAPSNVAMYRTNTSFGYRPVEVLHEMQRRDT
jgi:GNAT superfamily N-acetyltransferase